MNKITRKDFIQKTFLGALFGAIAVKQSVASVAAATTPAITDNLILKSVHIGNNAPKSKDLLWINTTTNPATPCYFNGSEWVPTNSDTLDGKHKDYFENADNILSNRIGVNKGGAQKPVYVDANGNLQACQFEVPKSTGSVSKPVYVDASGNVKPCNIDVNPNTGSVSKPVYIDASGNVKPCNIGVNPSTGSASKPVYVDANGNLQACQFEVPKSVGSVNRPVYIDANGNVQQCNIWIS